LEEHLEIQQRRSRAVRTAWAMAVVAVLIFVMFILSGVMGS
jgi:predicted nucleic acid-binding Zn ribbon protein